MKHLKMKQRSHPWLTVILLAAFVLSSAVWERSYRHEDSNYFELKFQSLPAFSYPPALYLKLETNCGTATCFFSRPIRPPGVRWIWHVSGSYIHDIFPINSDVLQKNRHGFAWRHSHGVYNATPTQDEYLFSWPLWLTSLIALLPAWVLIRPLTLLKRKPASPSCATCGYDLRATPARCPECGTTVGKGLRRSTQRRLPALWFTAPFLASCLTLLVWERRDWFHRILAPPAVTSLRASAGGCDRINLVWVSNAPSAHRQEVWRTDDGERYVKIASLRATAGSYTDTNLPENTDFLYEVRAVGVIASSPCKAEWAMTTPAAPSGLTATPGDGVAYLKWVNHSVGATFIQIYRSPDGKKFSYIATVQGETKYTDWDSWNGAMNYYKVAGVNPGGCSSDSNIASVKPVATLTLVDDLGITISSRFPPFPLRARRH